MSALTSEFIRSFSPAVLVRPVWFIPSNLRRIISGDCLLPHMIFQMSASTRLRLERRSGESQLYISDKLNVDHRAYPKENHADSFLLDNGRARRLLQIRPTRRLDQNGYCRDTSFTPCTGRTVFCRKTRTSSFYLSFAPCLKAGRSERE